MGKNCRVIQTAFLAAAVCAAVLCFVLASCGGGGSSPELVPAGAMSTGAGLTPAIDADALAVPEEVDPGLWAQLTAELKSASAGLRHTGPPLNAVNQVTDLVLAEADEGGYLLSWGYLNTGDYNCDGLVNASDMTPVGIYYGRSVAGPDWQAAQAADGNGDGTIGLGDITTIGQNYGNKVAGYLLEVSETPEDAESWVEVTRVAIGDSEVADKLPNPRFIVSLDSFSYDGYYRATPYRVMTGWIERGIDGAPVLLAEDKRGHWWMEGGDNHHSSYASLPGPLTNHLWWSVEIGGDGKSGPVLDSQGRIYVGGEAGLYMVEPDGSSFQCYTTPEPVETTPALAHDGTVYFGCLNGNLYALGPDRLLKWIFHASSPLTNSPAIADDGTVWFADEAGMIYALAPDGTVVFEEYGSSAIECSPAIDADGWACFSGTSSLIHYPYPGLEVYLRFDWPVLAQLPYYAEGNDYGGVGMVVNEFFLTRFSDHFSAVPKAFLETHDYDACIDFPVEQELLTTPPMLSPDGGIHVIDTLGLLAKYSVPGAEDNWAVLDRRAVKQAHHGAYRATLDCTDRVFITSTADYFTHGFLYVLNPDGSMNWEMKTNSRTQPLIASGNSVLVVTRDGLLEAYGGSYSGAFPWSVSQLELSPGCTTMELTWTSSNGADRYEVFRDGGENPVHVVDRWQNNKSESLTWKDEGLTPGTVYSYQVLGSNSIGTGLPSLTVEAETRLLRPAEFTASQGIYPDRIELAWEPSVNATGYRIWRDRNQGNPDPVAVVGLVESWVDTEILDWDNHHYSIEAFSESTTSDSSTALGCIARGTGDTGAGNWQMTGGDIGHRRLAQMNGPGIASLGWQQDIEYDHLRSFGDIDSEPLFGDSGAIYLANKGNYNFTLIALNPDGTLRWSAPSNCQYPAILDDGAVVTSNGSRFIVYNPDGTERLESETHGLDYYLVTPSGNLVGTYRSTIYSLTPAGEIEWQYEFTEDRRRPYRAIVVSDGIYMIEGHDYTAEPYPGPGSVPVNHEENIVALNLDGTLKWSSPDMQNQGRLALGNPGMLFACFDDALHALNTSDGSIIWSYPLTGDLAVNAAGQVVCAGDDELVVLNPDGSLAWSYLPPESFSCSYPIVDAAGTVFFNEVNYGEPDVDDTINRLVALDSTGNYAWDYEQTGCSGHAIKSIRDDGALLWYTKNGEDDVPTLTLIEP